MVKMWNFSDQFCYKLVGIGSKNRRIIRIRVESYRVKINQNWMSIKLVKMWNWSKIFDQFCNKLVEIGSKNRQIIRIRVECYRIKINEMFKWIRIECQLILSKCENCQRFSINFARNWLEQVPKIGELCKWEEMEISCELNLIKLKLMKY